MLLQQDRGQWSLIITGGDNQPTTFKVIVVEKKKFVAENLANEFPQKIRYFENAANLNAVISGKENEISFEFRKIPNDQK